MLKKNLFWKEKLFFISIKILLLLDTKLINIDGLGKKVIEKFWDLNFIRLPQDIFNLDYIKIYLFKIFKEPIFASKKASKNFIFLKPKISQ